VPPSIRVRKNVGYAAVGDSAIVVDNAPMPPLVILVRHAQSEHHGKGITGGWTDTPLTDLGRVQASRLADRLRSELEGIPVTLYTSDLLRAAQTARIIGRALGANPIPEPRLREFNNGEAANMTMADFMEKHGHVLGCR
jgi:broad specificity phosphatase PhoE